MRKWRFKGLRVPKWRIPELFELAVVLRRISLSHRLPGSSGFAAVTTSEPGHR